MKRSNIILVALLLLASIVSAQNHKQPFHRKVAQLQLDKTQKEWARKINSDTRNTINPYRTEIKELKKEYDQLVSSYAVDFAALDNNIERRNALTDKIQQVRLIQQDVFSRILDESQLELFNAQKGMFEKMHL